jgi:hypothetical protein
LNTDHFRCQVERSACFEIGFCAYFDLFGETEVAELDVAILEYEQILGLDIVVDDVEAVEILEAQDSAGQDEPHGWLPCLPEEILAVAAVGEERVDVPSLGPFHHNVVVFLVSEDAVVLSDEGRCGCLEDVPLNLYVLHQILALYVDLLHPLYGV